MKKMQQQLPLGRSKLKRKQIRVESMADLEEGRGSRGPKPRGFVVRFWEMVEKGAPDECWEWKGQRDTKTNYGLISICNWPYLAHRISYLIEHGSIDPDLLIMHSCDNRICVNPHHLSQGTHADNSQDAWIKGRLQKGERNGMAKLSSEQVIEIRNRRCQGESLASIASKYGVWPAAIWRITKGIRWNHLIPPSL